MTEEKKRLVTELQRLMKKEMEADVEYELLTEEAKEHFGIDFSKAENLAKEQRIGEIFKDPKLREEFANFMLKGLKLEARLRVFSREIREKGERLKKLIGSDDENFFKRNSLN